MYSFDSWSNGSPASFAYSITAQDETIIANYSSIGTCNSTSNASPIAFADSATLGMNTSQVIDVLNNDSDSDGALDKGSVSVIQQPQEGVIKSDATC